MKQIIAMGGGGFSMEPDNLALDRYVLEQTSKSTPRVCFIPTASGDADGYIVKFYSAFTRLDCVPSHLSLFRLPTTDLQSFVLEKDVIYVGGGNTQSMLSLWREWELDEILREALRQGVVLAGLSAGGMCWFKQCLTDSIPEQLGVLDCLGFLPGSFCPHYDGEKERPPVYRRLVSEGSILPGYGADNGAALHFMDGKLKCIVSSRPNARVYIVERVSDRVREQVLESMCLLA